MSNVPYCLSFSDTADSVSRELVEASLIDGRDMIVGKSPCFMLWSAYQPVLIVIGSSYLFIYLYTFEYGF